MSSISQEALEFLESAIDAKINKALEKAGKTTFRSRVLSTDQNGTTWITIPGVADRVPVDFRLSEVSDNDVVQATFEEGVVTIDGNASSPATSREGASQQALYAIAAAVNPDLLQAKTLKVDNLIADFVAAESADLKQALIEYAKIHYADIDFANIDVAAISQAFVDELVARSATFETVEAVKAVVDDLDVNYAHITDGVIDNATIGYADVDDLDVHYAHIDLANVNNAWIEDGVIRDAAIGDAQIIGVSANKLTAGTIDAGRINVINLSTENLLVKKINGQPVIGGYAAVDRSSAGYSSANPSANGWYEFSDGRFALSQDTAVDDSKVYYSATQATAIYDQAYIDQLADDLDARIDAQIETWTGDDVPLLNNYPASDWTTEALRDEHVGDIFYVVNAANEANGYCYRFARIHDESTGVDSYEWVLIKDSDVTKALQDLLTAQGDISGLKDFQTTTASWMTNTDAELTSVKGRTTTLETDMGTKVSTTTFNQLKQEVDENSSTITNLSETMQRKLVASASGQRSITTTDAAELPLLTLDPVYGECVQNGTPTPDAPVYIQAVRSPNLLSGTRDCTGQCDLGSGTRVTTPLYPNTTASISTNVAWAGPYLRIGPALTAAGVHVGETVTLSIRFTVTSTTTVTTPALYLYRVTANTQAAAFGTRTLKAGEWITLSHTFTVTEGAKQMMMTRFEFSAATDYNVIWAAPMLVVGSHAGYPYIPEGSIAIPCSNGNTAYLDMTDPSTGEPVELYALNDTYRDILHIDSSGHALVEKRCHGVTFNGTENWANHDAGKAGTTSLTNRYALKTTAVGFPQPSGTVGMCSHAGWRGNYQWGTVDVNSDGWMIFYDGDNQKTLSTFKDWISINTPTLIYSIAKSDWYTIDLGYVDLPTVSDGSTVYVAAEVQPVIGGSWWTKDGSEVGGVETVQRNTVNEVKQTATENSSTISKLEKTTDGLTSRLSTAETKITQNENAIALRATKTEMTQAIADISVGGRNLLLNSNDSSKWPTFAPSSYLIAVVGLTIGNLVKGETYTITIWGAAPTRSDKSTCWYSVYWGGGSVNLCNVSMVGIGYDCKGSATFTAPNSTHVSVNNPLLYIYNTPLVGTSGTTYSGEILYLKLERGNVPTDWTPAPEDMASQAELKVQADRIGMVVKNSDASSSLQLTPGAIQAVTDNLVIKDSSNSKTVISGGKIQASSLTIGMLDTETQTKVNNGNSALTKVNYYNRSCQVGQNTTPAGNVWYKFASVISTTSYEDLEIVFDVYNAGAYGSKAQKGTLSAHFRIGSTKVLENAQLYWVNRTEGIVLSDFVLAYTSVSGTSTTVELWVRCPTAWAGWQFFVVAETNRTAVRSSAQWTLYNNYNSSGGSAAITSGYTQIQSADIDSARTTATNYIAADSSGIRIASANPATQNQRLSLTSSAAEFYDSGNTRRVRISSADGVILGRPTSGSRTQVTDAGLRIYNSSNVDTAFFGSTARVGPENAAHVAIDSNQFRVRNKWGPIFQIQNYDNIISKRKFIIDNSHSIDYTLADMVANKEVSLGYFPHLPAMEPKYIDSPQYIGDGDGDFYYDLYIFGENKMQIVDSGTISCSLQPGDYPVSKYIDGMYFRYSGNVHQPNISVIWTRSIDVSAYPSDLNVHIDFSPGGYYYEFTTYEGELTNLASLRMPEYAGTIVPFAGPENLIPKNWLLCDGSWYNVNDYWTLFGKIGTTYTDYTADNANKYGFQVPDLSMRVPMGQLDADAYPLGQIGGSVNMQSHSHTVNNHAHGMASGSGYSIVYSNNGIGQHKVKSGSDTTNVYLSVPSGKDVKTSGRTATDNSAPGTSAAGTGHEDNLQPFLVVNYIIHAGYDPLG